MIIPILTSNALSKDLFKASLTQYRPAFVNFQKKPVLAWRPASCDPCQLITLSPDAVLCVRQRTE
jgi:hypothetical protein